MLCNLAFQAGADVAICASNSVVKASFTSASICNPLFHIGGAWKRAVFSLNCAIRRAFKCTSEAHSALHKAVCVVQLCARVQCDFSFRCAKLAHPVLSTGRLFGGRWCKEASRTDFLAAGAR